MEWYFIVGAIVACLFMYFVGYLVGKRVLKWGEHYDGAFFINEDSTRYPWQVHVDIPLDKMAECDVIRLRVVNHSIKELEKMEAENENPERS